MDPGWSWDAGKIVFASYVDGDSNIYRISAQGGNLKQLTGNPADDGGPCWSRHEEWIYFHSNRGGEYNIWRMSNRGGSELQLTTQGGTFPSESLDGQFLYYLKGDKPSEMKTLWRVSVQGGDEKPILQSIFAINFALGKEGIYFIPFSYSRSEKDVPGPGSLPYDSVSRKTRSPIDFYNFATGQTTRLAWVGLPLWGFTVSPDENWVLYTQFDKAGNDLMLVEGFH